MLARLKALKSRFGSLARGKGSPVRDSDEELGKALRKVAEKNRRLKKLRGRVKRKDRELTRLKIELERAQNAERNQDFSLQGTPVFFIVGRARSGTSWLMRMLDAHPEILCKGEGRFFGADFKREDFKRAQLKNIPPSSLYSAMLSSEYLRFWAERSVWSSGDDVDEHLINLTRLATEYFLANRLSKTGKRIVGDKTPLSSAEVLSEISAIYPEAKTIHIIRDGRDVAVSTMHHMWNHAKNEGRIYDLTSEELEKRDAYREGSLAPPAGSLFTKERLTGIAAGWSIEVGKAVEDGPALLGENYVEVRYEHLLQRPEEEVRRLLEFLGADASEEVVERCVELANFETWTKGRERGQEDSTAFLRKGVAGDWRNVFTEDDKRVFKRAGGELLIKLGYERDNDW
jgi:hypothetical protein